MSEVIEVIVERLLFAIPGILLAILMAYLWSRRSRKTRDECLRIHSDAKEQIRNDVYVHHCENEVLKERGQSWSGLAPPKFVVKSK